MSMNVFNAAGTAFLGRNRLRLIGAKMLHGHAGYVHEPSDHWRIG